MNPTVQYPSTQYPSTQYPTTQYPAAVLRVAPEAIPTLRAAVQATLAELRPHLARMQGEAHMAEPWLHDSASYETWRLYTDRVMGAADGPFHAMLAYERQLVVIDQRLGEIADRYARAEAETDAELRDLR